MMTQLNILNKLSNTLMTRGNKSNSEELLYHVLSELNYQYRKDPVVLIEKMIKQLIVIAEVRSKKRGGTSRLVPTPTPQHRQIPLGIRLFREAVRIRPERTFKQRILGEAMNLYQGRGESLKKRNNIHYQVEINRANVSGKKTRRHYRW